ETYNYLTDPGFIIATATTEPDVDIDGITGGLGTSPLASGSANVAVVGFSLEASGDVEFQQLTIHLSSTTSGKFSNFRLFESSNNSYGPADTEFTGATIVVQPTQIDITLSEALEASTTRY